MPVAARLWRGLLRSRWLLVAVRIALRSEIRVGHHGAAERIHVGRMLRLMSLAVPRMRLLLRRLLRVAAGRLIKRRGWLHPQRLLGSWLPGRGCDRCGRAETWRSNAEHRAL